ncbi:MAG: sigma-70 family RNA polymerase sigma factor [Candidatus Krumholzibacteriota bacterium]|nr:sigma-70 family RNA polymerase sigma factor [Candidatus Krumholzibacteriota bacterium]
MKDDETGDESLNLQQQYHGARAASATLSDEELILLVQQGNNQAFDILVGRYKNRLYAYLFRLLGNESEAEEYAQEAFVRAYMHADKYKTIAKFSTWLYTIATNLVRNRIRNIKRRPKTISMWSDERSSDDGRWLEIRDESPDPEETMDRKRLNELIQIAIDKIPAKYRPSFVLREINGLSYEEIAASTGLKLGTVRSRINRGRMHFKKAVTPLLGDDNRFKEID